MTGKIEIIRTKGSPEMNKRQHLPFIVKSTCSSCGGPVKTDLNSNYLSYPSLGRRANVWLYCDPCGDSEDLHVVFDGDITTCDAVSEGAKMIAAERKRQLLGEGFSMERDDAYTNEELVCAALHYAKPDGWDRLLLTDMGYDTYDVWPVTWDRKWDKADSKSRIEQLAIAGALIAAEIDRLKRQEKGDDEREEADG